MNLSTIDYIEDIENGQVHELFKGFDSIKKWREQSGTFNIATIVRALKQIKRNDIAHDVKVLLAPHIMDWSIAPGNQPEPQIIGVELLPGVPYA